MALENLGETLNIKDLKISPPDDSAKGSDVKRGGADFYIKIDFEKGSGSPSRVFRAMSDLIDALQETDKSLVRSIDAKLQPILLLEDVESGSVKAWLKQAIESVDDEGLKKGDWKVVVGNYLLKAKYLMVNFLDKKTDIKGTQEIAVLERDLHRLAEETDVRQFPAYEPISREALVRDLDKINSALAPLNDADKASFVTNEGEAAFNLSLYIAPETIEDLITAESIQSISEMILKVKKPDFLGTSQWEFRHDNRNIPAKILDEAWLTSFQNGDVPVRPGDAIRAEVLTEVKYGFDRDVVSTQYSVLRVLRVIPKNEAKQSLLFQPSEPKPNPDEEP